MSLLPPRPTLPSCRTLAFTRSRFRPYLPPFFLLSPFLLYIFLSTASVFPFLRIERTVRREFEIRRYEIGAPDSATTSGVATPITIVTELSRYRSSSLPYVMRADVLHASIYSDEARSAWRSQRAMNARFSCRRFISSSPYCPFAFLLVVARPSFSSPMLFSHQITIF